MTTKLLDKKVTELTVRDALKAGLMWAGVTGFTTGMIRGFTSYLIKQRTSNA